MSYILDALRKSDQQRQYGVAPTLQTMQMSVRASAPPPLWVYCLLGFTLLGAGLAVGWLRPWQEERQVTPVKPVVPRQADAQPAPAPLAMPVPTESVLSREIPRKQAEARPRQTAPVKRESALPSAQAPAVESAGASRAASETAVLPMSELPPAIRQEIPPMVISVHAYSPRPADRMVSINDRLLREGGSVPPGLTLDEITPEGMVFSYKGYRFNRGLGPLGPR